MRLNKLTGLRGLAALIVFISHSANEGYLPSIFGKGFGQIGVMIFFLLSGYLMGYLYICNNFDEYNVKKYILARIGRVFPLYLSVVTLSILITYFVDASFHYNIESIKDIVFSYFFVMARKELWTIPVEVQFYLIFIIYWWVFARSKSLLLAILFISVTTIPTLLTVSIKGEYFKIVSSYSPIFFAGVLLAINNNSLKSINPKVINILGIIALFSLFVNVPETRRMLGLYYNDTTLYLTWLDPISWMIILVLFIATVLNSSSLKILESRALIFLGEISFGFYLFHRPVLKICNEYFEQGIGTLAVPLLLTCILAGISFYFFEKPAAGKIRSFA